MTLEELTNKLLEMSTLNVRLNISNKDFINKIRDAKIVIRSPDGLIDLARVKYDEKENEIELEYD